MPALRRGETSSPSVLPTFPVRRCFAPWLTNGDKQLCLASADHSSANQVRTRFALRADAGSRRVALLWSATRSGRWALLRSGTAGGLAVAHGACHHLRRFLRRWWCGRQSLVCGATAIPATHTANALHPMHPDPLGCHPRTSTRPVRPKNTQHSRQSPNSRSAARLALAAPVPPQRRPPFAARAGNPD